MARAIWTGSIGFGMVHIPVSLYTAAAGKDISFNRWDPATKTKPRQVQLDGNGKEMALADMTRIFEVSKGVNVEIKPEDLEAIEPELSRHMPVLEFVPRESVDPLFIEKTYFLGFGKLGQNAYALFLEALKAEGRAAIVKCFMKTKEHLAMVWVNEDALCLSTLFYEDEIVRANAVGGKFGEPLPEVSEPEVAMARQLINMLNVETFDASKYKDEHRAKVLAMIEAKAAGTAPTAKPTLVTSEPVRNILDTLAESIAKNKVAA